MKKFLPLSYSSLKQFAISPNHFLAYRTNTSLNSMTLGTAHLGAEPEEFDSRYYVMPDGIRRGTNAYKEYLSIAASRGEEVEIIRRAACADREERTISLTIRCCTTSEVPHL